MEMTDEQRKVIEERLKNMSPEELAQMQQQQCIFCQIAHSKIPSKTIFEDDRVKVVLDINPASPGHCIVIPKEHYMILPQAPKDLVAHMSMIAKQVSHTLLRSLKVDGTSWSLANGALAGQRAQHVMLHLIPRVDDDNIGLQLPKTQLNQQTAQVIKDKLAPVMDSILKGEVQMFVPEKPTTTPSQTPHPQPAPTPEPVSTPEPKPTPQPTPTATPEPTPPPTPEPTPQPTPTPAPEPTPPPTPEPRPTPTPTPTRPPQPAPVPEPEPTPSSEPTPLPEPTEKSEPLVPTSIEDQEEKSQQEPEEENEVLGEDLLSEPMDVKEETEEQQKDEPEDDSEEQQEEESDEDQEEDDQPKKERKRPSLDDIADFFAK